MADPVTVIHESSPQERYMRLMQMQNGGMGRGRSNPAQAVGGVAELLGGGCVLAAGIIQAVMAPPQITLSGTYATDAPEIQDMVNASATGGFAGGILNSIGGGLLVVAGGAQVVGGMMRR